MRDRHQLEQMPIGRFEINTAAATPIVQLGVVAAPGRASINQASFLDAMKDGIEFCIRDMKCIMMALKIAVLIEEEGEALVDLHRREVLTKSSETKAKELCDLPRGRFLVSGRDDGVIEHDGHGHSR